MSESVSRRVQLRLIGGGELGDAPRPVVLGDRLTLGAQELVISELVYGGSPPALMAAGVRPVEREPELKEAS